jgi:D-alanine-D-alanine ligase
VDPPLGAVGGAIREAAVRLAGEMGVRHLCRVDFLMDSSGVPWLLEVNTMPGFTTHSLLPKAAAKAGMDFTALTERLVDMALADQSRR